MHDRFSPRALLLIALAVPIAGCTNPLIDSLAVAPTTQTLTVGQTIQFTATGTVGHGSNHPSTTQDDTDLVVWTSSTPSVATISSTGLATGVAAGSTTITATMNGFTGVTTASATVTVTGPVSGGGGTNLVTALTIFPGSQAATSLGQQAQFTVLGTEGGVQFDVSSQVVWSSTIPSVATVNTAPSATPGLVTADAAGTTTIEATYTNPNGSKVIATAGYSVTAGASPEPLLSISVVPSGVTVSNKGMTAQYLAFGTYSTPPLTRDITNQVTWISLLPEVASINSSGAPGEVGGLATAEGYTGFTPIYAEDTKSNPDGTVVLSNSQTFTCKDANANVCVQGVATPQFATVSVFVEGENTFVPNLTQIGPDGLPFGEYVTAPSDTGTPNLIHCDVSGSSSKGSSGSNSQWKTVGGTGGVVCVGTYEAGSTLTLTENLPIGSTSFGGWSTGTGETLTCTIQTGATVSNTCGSGFDPTNPPAGWYCNTVTTGAGTPTVASTSACYDPIPCTPAVGHTLANSPTCTLPLYGDATVGLIFY